MINDTSSGVQWAYSVIEDDDLKQIIVGMLQTISPVAVTDDMITANHFEACLNSMNSVYGQELVSHSEGKWFFRQRLPQQPVEDIVKYVDSVLDREPMAREMPVVKALRTQIMPYDTNFYIQLQRLIMDGAERASLDMIVHAALMLGYRLGFAEHNSRMLNALDSMPASMKLQAMTELTDQITRLISGSLNDTPPPDEDLDQP